MNKKMLLPALALVCAAPSAMASLASCGSGTTALGANSTELFGNAFSSAHTFSDCYSFSIGSSVNAFGGTLEIDPLSFLDIDVTSVTLSGGGLATSLVDNSPGSFSFNNLLAGTYQLVVSGLVTKGKDWSDILPLPVGYAGSLSTHAVAAVPEPETYTLLAVGLGVMGWLARRRRREV